MSENTTISKNEIISALTKSPHGKLLEYAPIGRQAAAEDAEFLAHLVAYDRLKGQIRDSKVALPVIYLAHGTLRGPFISNALAHLAMLAPRDLLRAYRFGLELRDSGIVADYPCRGEIRRLIARYLRAREQKWGWFEKSAVQHRATMRSLYAIAHIKPSEMADAVLFKGMKPKGSVFEAIANLKDMSASEAAGTIMERKIPFLIARGALGAKANDPDLVMAMIERMSPTELVTSSKMLERLGVKTVPALRAAYEQALGRAGTSKKATFKATRALAPSEDGIEDDGLRAKLQALQERQIKALGGVDGNWLVLGDASPSMDKCIEAARQVAGTLAKVVKGNVHLIFFNSVPRHFDVTGKTYEAILEDTKYVIVGGGTSIGCGLLHILDKKIAVDGIAIVSDAQENTAPAFAETYGVYSKFVDKQVPVYLYRFTPGSRGFQDRDLSTMMKASGYDLQEFDLRGGFDHYSLPGIIATMRTNRYSLIDEIMACKLLDLEIVLPLNQDTGVTVGV